MKKLSLLFAICVIALSSCKKYELSEDLTVANTLESFQKVTVSGVCKAELDGTTLDVTEFVPSGTILTFSVKNSDYGIPEPSTEHCRQYFTTTVGANGKYSIEIPVPTKTIQVEVTSNDFIHLYKETNEISYNANYQLPTTIISVNPATNDNIEDLQFVKTSLVYPSGEINPTKTVTLSGKLEYIKKQSKIIYIPPSENSNPLYTVVPDFKSDTVDIPAGTKVNAEITLTEYNGDPSNPATIRHTKIIEVTVGSNGSYSVNVPMINNGKATIELKGYVNLQYTDSKDDAEYSASENHWVVTNKSTTNYLRYELDKTVVVYEFNKTDQDFVYSHNPAQPLD